MSSFTQEAFLYDLAYQPGALERFKQAPDKMLDEYPLTDQERADLKNWKVKAIHANGVSPMLLLLSYISVHGMQHRTTYLRSMGMTGDDLAPHALSGN